MDNDEVIKNNNLSNISMLNMVGVSPTSNSDAGVIFCPYIPGQSSNENDIPETYGILYDECDKFYTMINVSGL